MKIEQVIEKHALENALKHEGKANPKAVVGSVIGESPESKKDMKNTAKLVEQAVQKINKLSLQEQKELAKKYPEIFEKKHSKPKDELKELEDVPKTGVIMRFAPSPSGPMHIGHALTGGLTSLYVEKYFGRFILRIEDTNTDNIYLPAYDLLPNDAEWIFGNVSEVWVQSDRMQIYYNYIEKFLEQGNTYVCTCSQEAFKKIITQKKACPCRELPKKEQKERWKKMLDTNGFKEGDAVIRFKTDVEHKNPAMRDFPLARINTGDHARQGFKYRVWPLMNLSVFVDDVEAGMTHIIRAKDHADNAKRQEFMYNALKKQIPKSYFVGRINFLDMELSTTKTKEKIEKGEFLGWDDIRLPFLGALKRRGYQAEAFKEYSKRIGISLTDKTVSKEEFFKNLDAYNKDIIDKRANRYFFVHDPIELSIKDFPETQLELKLHPDEPKRGVRKFDAGEHFLIAREDFEKIKDGEIVRLMDCLNFSKDGYECRFDSLGYEKFKEKGSLIIHWLTQKDNVETEILMPDGTIKKGLAERNVLQEQEGFVVQFERFGFCRLDKKEDDKLTFWFAHK